MDKVAVLIGNDNETISFLDSGTLKIFLKQEVEWEIIDEMTLSIDYPIGISSVRKSLLQIAKRLDDCNIVVGKKVSGIFYNVFETMKFSIWEFDGKPEMFLDYIIDKEKEYLKSETKTNSHGAKQRVNQELTYIKKLSDGYYVVDLEELQSLNRNISSKQALIPVLEKREFKKLDIFCSHIPPWIENHIEKYQLKIESEKLCSGGYKVSLFVK